MLFSAIRWLAPDGQVNQGDVRIVEGRIAVLSERPLTPLAGERVVRGSDRLLLPGFANLHGHLPMTLLRGLGEGLSLHDWLTGHIFPFEAAMDDEDYRLGTELALLESLASGVTTQSDMYMRLPILAEVVRQSGVRANLAHGLIAGETPFHRRQGVLDTLALLNQQDDWLKIDVGLHAEYTADEETVQGVAELAREYGLGVHVHVSETRAEHQACLERHGCTPLGWLARHGVLESPCLIAHGVHLSDEDLELAAAHDVTPVHCPSSNLKLGSGIARLADWQKHGLRFVVGTDGAASNNNLNYLEELHLAALIHKGSQENPLLLPPAALFRAATADGYRAQGRPDGGVIISGAPADLCVLDLAAPHLLPAHDLLSSLFYSAQAADVWMTMVAGRVLYENGDYKTLDAERIRYEAPRRAAAVLRRL